jgi:hypothetical protein
MVLNMLRLEAFGLVSGVEEVNQFSVSPVEERCGNW